MSVWKAIFLGLLQGFTEFLPVSSSGHLAVAQNFFGFDSGQSVTFTVLLHLGTLAAVCIMYRRDVWMIIKGFFTLVGKLFTGRLRREGLESGEMLDIIFATRSFDLGTVFNWGGILGQFMTVDTNFVSRFESVYSQAEKALEDTLTALENMS